MATFYLDPDGGSDAADGLTFANRWKTITLGATAARITPGDTIRIIGRVKKSTGIDATFTNYSPTVTLASALNALITDCETNWTASANVTCTTSTTRRVGSFGQQMAIAAGFTTGKIAYFDLGSNQDYSAYQGISLWMYSSVAFASGVYEIKLCSDAIGDVPVNTIAMAPNGSMNTGFRPLYMNYGSALGSAIRSIAFYAVSDPGTITLNIDNIITVKAKGTEVDNLNLTSMISKGANGPWWPIRGIEGVTVTLEQWPGFAFASVSRGWVGTTGSGALYKWETVKIAATAGAFGTELTINDSGTLANPILFSGGWNQSDMSAQDGESWLDGQWAWTVGLSLQIRHYVNFEKINPVRWFYGYYFQSSNGGVLLGLTRLSGIQSYGVLTNTVDNFTTGDLEFTAGSTVGLWRGSGTNHVYGNILVHGGYKDGSAAAVSINVGSSFTVMGNLDLQNGGHYGMDLSGPTFGLKIGNITMKHFGGGGFYWGLAYEKCGNLSMGDVLVDDCLQGIIPPMVGGWRWRIKSLTIQNGTYGIQGGFPMNTIIKSLVTSGNANFGWRISSGNTIGGRVKILSSSLTDSVPRSDGALMTLYQGKVPVSFRNYLGGAHRIEYGCTTTPHAIVTSESGGNRHTLSGLGWKLAPLNATYNTSTFPVRHTLAQVYCEANALVTLRLWVNRSDTGLTVKLVQPGRQINGVSVDVVDTAVATAGTWEELEITCTPTEKGPIWPEIQAYGGSTYYVYFDDMTITQA